MDKVYLFAEPASKSGIRFRTSRMYDDIDKLCIAIVNKYNDMLQDKLQYFKASFHKDVSFEHFVRSGNYVSCYMYSLNDDNSPKRIGNKALWKLLTESDLIKKELVKLSLKDRL